MRRATAVLIALAIGLTACGGGDGLSDEETQAAAETARSIDSADPEFISYLGGDQVDLTCWTEALVGDLGVEGTAAIRSAESAEEVDAAFAGLSEGDLNAAADSLLGCVDRDAIKADMADLASEEAIDCALDTMLNKDTYRISFAAIVKEDRGTLEGFEDQLATECGFG